MCCDGSCGDGSLQPTQQAVHRTRHVRVVARPWRHGHAAARACVSGDERAELSGTTGCTQQTGSSGWARMDDDLTASAVCVLRHRKIQHTIRTNQACCAKYAVRAGVSWHLIGHARSRERAGWALRCSPNRPLVVDRCLCSGEQAAALSARQTCVYRRGMPLLALPPALLRLLWTSVASLSPTLRAAQRANDRDSSSRARGLRASETSGA